MKTYLVNKWLVNKWLVNKYLVNKYKVNKYTASAALGILLTACSAPNYTNNNEPAGHTQTVTNHSFASQTSDTNANWRLIWQDEFDQRDIDLSKWSFEQNCFGGGNSERQCYTSRRQNAYIEDGKLVIRALQEEFTGPAKGDDDPRYSIDDTRTLPYTSARLRSKGKGDWRYGRFEIRAKLPYGQGTWPAIWMLPTDWVYGGWASSGEIDIMEAVNLKATSDAKFAASDGMENRVHGTLHYGQAWPNNVHTGAGFNLPNNVNPADGFHTYAIEWEQGEIRWYVDGIHYATQRAETWYTRFVNPQGQLEKGSADAPFDQRFHLILNLAVGGAWPEAVNDKGIDARVFPQSLQVDYVRVYQCAIDTVTGLGCATIGEQALQVK